MALLGLTPAPFFFYRWAHRPNQISHRDAKKIGIPMRRTFLLAAAAIAALSAVGSVSPAAAAEVQDRYCLQGDYGYPGNCHFSTYEQCRATASGTLDGCGINPRYAFAPPKRGDVRIRYPRVPLAYQ
jgi:hypothetical protein